MNTASWYVTICPMDDNALLLLPFLVSQYTSITIGDIYLLNSMYNKLIINDHSKYSYQIIRIRFFYRYMYIYVPYI